MIIATSMLQEAGALCDSNLTRGSPLIMSHQRLVAQNILHVMRKQASDIVTNAGYQSEHTNPQRLQLTEHAALVGGKVNSHALRIIPQPAAGRDVSMEETCQYCASLQQPSFRILQFHPFSNST